MNGAAGLPNGPLRFMARAARRRAPHFAALWAVILVAASCGIAAQYAMKLIVDTMAQGRHDAAIWEVLGLFIGLIAAESVFWRLSGWLGCLTVVAVGIDVRLDLFDYLSGHSPDYVARHSSGALGGRITATAGAAGALVATLTWKIAPPCVDFVGAAVVLLTVQPWMAAALSLFVVLVATIIIVFGRRGRAIHQAYATEASRVNGELVDVVGQLWTLQAFSARRREYERASALIAAEAQAQRRSWLYLEKARVLHDLCLWVMAGTMMVWALRGWQAGVNTPGDVVVVSALSFRILHGSRDLALALIESTQQLGIVREMLQVVAVPQEPGERPGARPFVPGPGAIRLRNVSFSYPDGTQVFRHLDLDIPAGERVGIVGPSGSGKTTLLGLLQRMQDVQGGEVLIDGQNVAQLTLDSLRGAMAVVPQEISLLHRTVGENVAYARPAASEAELQQAARAAHCEEFIRELPQGYDTVVGERGARLSGGQRQRIGIARAMLKNARILLLDEATSALDSASERKIQRALGHLVRGRTVLAVAHRLSTVAGFDRVLVLVDGKIVEDGAPDRLRHAGGLYQRLWAAQAQGQETA